MYSIRIRVNHLKKVLTHETKESVPIHLDNGREPYIFWRGFTLVEKQPVKLVVDAFAGDYTTQEIMLKGSMIGLEEGEYLAGSMEAGCLYDIAV